MVFEEIIAMSLLFGALAILFCRAPAPPLLQPCQFINTDNGYGDCFVHCGFPHSLVPKGT